MDPRKMIYIWDSSIPEKWKKIVGEDHFVHISKSSKAKNTLEFMTETQKYIEKIRNLSKSSESEDFFQSNQNLRPSRNNQSISINTSPEEKPLREYTSPVNNPTKLNLAKETSKDEKKLPKIIRKYDSEVKFTRAHKGFYINKPNKLKYSKMSHLKHPEFLYLPQALQANSNRVLNSFSPRSKNFSLSLQNS